MVREMLKLKTKDVYNKSLRSQFTSNPIKIKDFFPSSHFTRLLTLLLKLMEHKKISRDLISSKKKLFTLSLFLRDDHRMSLIELRKKAFKILT